MVCPGDGVFVRAAVDVPDVVPPVPGGVAELEGSFPQSDGVGAGAGAVGSISIGSSGASADAAAEALGAAVSAAGSVAGGIPEEAAA